MSQNLTTNPTFSAFELKPHAVYRVKTSFTAHDGAVHPVGETWCYQSRNFFPYDAGLSLNVIAANGPRSILLQDYPETQGEIVSNFSNYVEEIKPPVLNPPAL